MAGTDPAMSGYPRIGGAEMRAWGRTRVGQSEKQ